MAVNVVISAFLAGVACALAMEEVGDFDCKGYAIANASLTAYYPEYDEELSPTGTTDALGEQLQNLQDFLDDRAEYVTVAMDSTLRVPYATPVCIPELNHHFGRRIHFEIRDSGSHLRGKKYLQIDVCVRDEADSYDRAVNHPVTLIF